MRHQSTPPFSNPSKIIHDVSIDLTETIIQINKTCSENKTEESKARTEVCLGYRPFVLITDDPNILAPIMKKTKYTSLVPFMKNQNDDMFEPILRKIISVCFSSKSLKNKEYIDFVAALIKQRQEELGKENSVKSKIKAFLLDGVESLPAELNGLFVIRISKDNTIDNIVEVLEGRPRAALEHVQNIINEMDLAPRQMISFRVVVPDNAEYLRKCWKSLLETFEDAGSFPRQHLLQLLHIPNVQTVRSESNSDKHEVCIEIQPNNIEDYLHFLEVYNSGQFQTAVQNNLKINSHTFIGELVTSLNSRDTRQVVKYFCPDVIKYKGHVLVKLIQESNLEELVKLIRETAAAEVRQDDRVHRLTCMCATQIYQAFLSRSDLSPFQYLRYLKKAGCPDFLTNIRSREGYNALHLAVKYESDDFMKMLFYANKWGCLRRDIVKPVNVKQETQHVGYVPRRLAEALSFKDTGFQILTQFDKYDLYWRYMPVLHKACLMGSIPFVSSVVDLHPDLMKEKDLNLANCLFYACASGNAKLVEYLLFKGAPRNVQNRILETPLHIAAMFGHLDVLNVLYSHFFEIRGRENRYGYNALYYSVRFGDIDALKLYLEKGFKIDKKALTIAAKHQQNELLEFIIKEVDDVNTGKDDEGRVALHYAVINGNAYAVKLLMKKDNIAFVDKYDKNVLHLAAEFGQKGIMNILINEAKQAGCLQQMISAKNIFTDMDLLIVIRGKDRGRKAWHWVELKRLYLKAFKQAMKSGQVDVVRYGLILKSGFGAYPDKECQKMMEKRLADILNERRSDMTPLHVAAIKDHPDLVEILLKNGADPNEKDYKGATAMHYAAMNNSILIMNHLCNAGASLDIETDDGQTPFNIAEELGNSAALNFLQASLPINMAKNFCDTLSRIESMLSEETLLELRKEGQDIRKYIIEHLRELIIDINEVLINLGSGPIQEATDEQENKPQWN